MTDNKPVIPDEFWKKKLMAYLHDPPCKAYGIARHEKIKKSNQLTFFDSFESMPTFEKHSDHTAAAADRFCFPNPIKNWPKENGIPLRTNWKDEGFPFIHPFCGTVLKPHSTPVTGNVAEDWMSKALDGCGISRKQTPEDFIKAWRLWIDRMVKNNSEAGQYMPYLVADTRIPDHTIWQHNSLVSALTNCGEAPSFLVFQIGPVQSFIEQAKKTRDLWAGSYLLSFLLAKAMEMILRKYGPDQFIFPQLRGNPIMDKMLWDVYGNLLDFTADAEENWREKQLLIPCMPNRFLCVFSEKDAQDAAEIAKKAVSDTWADITESCRKFIGEKFKCVDEFSGWDVLWNEQVSEFPRIEYLIEPFDKPEKIIEDFINSEPPYDENPKKHPVLLNHHWAVECIHHIGNEYYDSRNYKNRSEQNPVSKKWKSVLVDKNNQDLTSGQRALIDNYGFTWALNYMKTEWKFGALRNSRIFNQRPCFGNLAVERSNKWRMEKDPLDGVNEVLGGPKSKEFWEAMGKAENWKETEKDKDSPGEKRLFVDGQRYGAISTIKRLFDTAYLEDKYGFNVHQKNRIKSTHEIATGRKIKCEEEENNIIQENDCAYYVLRCNRTGWRFNG